MATPLRLQDLEPRMAKLCLAVEEFAREPFGSPLPLPPLQEGTLLLALSGGVDSTALAVIFTCLAPRLEVALYAAHLDHGLREDSAEDAAHVVELCNKLDIPLTSERRDVAALAAERGIGLEEAGREARADLMERVRAAHPIDIVLQGHQLDELAEDMLMRLIRGTGWPALAGMEAWDPQRALLRPLLLTSKSELQELVRSVGITWREDASNKDPAYMRNRVRLDILPRIAAENPNFTETAAGLWKLARLDASYWKERAASIPIHRNSEGVSVETAPLRAAPMALRLRVLKSAVETAGVGQPLLESLLNLDRAVMEKRTGAVIQLPGSKAARVGRNAVRIARSKMSR
ncbi:tRNA lysidine(34) synthetase TilS [Oceanidesulfovibrio marinus]|uniref:tRNA(Ile)-lysidine synthase n=1 Tax=Oceanidesulfovibrio marinus TaxID=370038 RepID=A0ABX6NC56_9BACT|nr:tRNA lysidine(34) synthetase TilS [Oceanidesulfovibrio marinus]QJT08178.1 tRNA lysidine(34) synthetase TilS [Oceanidesulfovibrio marinus]